MKLVLGYIDAASGSLLVQLLVGGLAGVGAFMKFRWHEIRARFRPTGNSADEARASD